MPESITMESKRMCYHGNEAQESFIIEAKRKDDITVFS